MQTKPLTAVAIRALKPQAKLYEVGDGGCAGLRVAVFPSGAKSFVHRYRRNEVSKKDTLGSVDSTTLAEARRQVTAARARLARDEPAPAVQSALQGGDAIPKAVAQFLALHVRRKNRPSTVQAAERVFRRDVLPAWRGLSVQSITRRDVIELIESIATDRPYLANRVRELLHKFFEWLRGRDAITNNPVSGVERPHREERRQRTLTDAELRALWLACADEGPFADAFRLLALTGTRRNEVSHMPWSEIDEDRLWILPKERTKNGREHRIALSDQAWTLIQNRPRFADCDFVFTTDGRRPINGWGRIKSRISERANVPETSWRLHDLRRTCAAGMQRLGVSVPVIEKALNHQSGMFRGIVGVYQTHDYADETRDAFARWANRVDEIVSGEPAKVVKLRQR
jgi:integrase